MTTTQCSAAEIIKGNASCAGGRAASLIDSCKYSLDHDKYWELVEDGWEMSDILNGGITCDNIVRFLYLINKIADSTPKTSDYLAESADKMVEYSGVVSTYFGIIVV